MMREFREFRKKYKFITKVNDFFLLLFLLSLLISILMEHVFHIDISSIVMFFLSISLVVGIVVEVFIWNRWKKESGIKEWESKHGRFGFMGTLVRIIVGVLIIVGLIYFVINLLPIPS